MKLSTIIFLLIITASSIYGEILYTGTIGTLPVTLSMTTSGVGFYWYDRVHIPISIRGEHRGSILTITEKGNGEEKPATGTFSLMYGADPENPPAKLVGQWKNQSNGKTLPVTLTQKLIVESYDAAEFTRQDYPMAIVTKDHYFMQIVSKKYAEEAFVEGLKVFSRETGMLVQLIDNVHQPRWTGDNAGDVNEINCEFRGGFWADTGDFNFDGLTDISLFTGYYGGTNNGSLFLIRDAKNLYTMAFTLVSSDEVDFDPKTKTITLPYANAVKTTGSNATYKWINNRLVKIAEECWEESEDGEFRKWECKK